MFVFDLSIDRLRELDVAFAGRASTVLLLDAGDRGDAPRVDLVIGAVLVHGAKAPHVVSREQLKLMKRNAVLVDVAIDQGGCFETSQPTTHRDPTFEVDGDHPLLRRQHAGRGADHLDLRAHERDAALRGGSGRSRRGEAIRGDRAWPGRERVADGKVTHPAVAEGVGPSTSRWRRGAEACDKSTEAEG